MSGPSLAPFRSAAEDTVSRGGELGSARFACLLQPDDVATHRFTLLQSYFCMVSPTLSLEGMYKRCRLPPLASVYET